MTYHAPGLDGRISVKPRDRAGIPAAAPLRPATAAQAEHGERDARTGDHWARVRNCYQQIAAQAPLPRAIAQAGNIPEAAIAHMLFNIERKGLFLQDIQVRDVIGQLMVDEIEIRSRHHLLGVLRRRGQIDPTLPDREFKPAGTQPCARTLGPVVEAEFGRSMTQIASPSRQREIARARFQSIWLMRHICGLSLNLIGGHFGGRDHTTVLNAINKVEGERMAQPGLAEKLERLCEEIDDLAVSQCYGRLVAAAGQDLS